jgi:MFS family permease
MDTGVARAPATTRPSLTAPLRNSLYRSIWIATLFSNYGVWIQMVAAAWLMTSIAPTPDFVAWVQAATALPPLVFTMLGGVLADRHDHRLIFLVGQAAMLLVALALSAFDGLGVMTPWLLLGLTFALDSGSALRSPAYQATIVEILPREQLPVAAVLGGIGWNLARATGPALGGLIIAVAGVPGAFAANALCNLHIVLVLARWRARVRNAKPKPTTSMAVELLRGFSHVRATPAIGTAMVCCFVFTCFASAIWSLLALVAKRLEGGPSTYGLLLGALGVGALAGGGVITRLRRRLGLRGACAAASLLVAAGTLAMATLPSVLLLLPVLALAGLGWMVALTIYGLVVQLAASGPYQGRMASVFYLSLFGGMFIGSWAWGHVAAGPGIRTGLLVATGGLVSSLLLYRRGGIARRLSDLDGPG